MIRLRTDRSMVVNAAHLTLYFFSGGAMVIYVKEQKSYGFWKFIGDCIMVFLTWGLWLIWIFVREMRRRSSSPF
jgi:hypothetical protein